MGAAGRAAAALPGGHVEGFGDTFGALFRAIYADVLVGRPNANPPYADFAAGHDEMLVNDAIAPQRSARAMSRCRSPFIRRRRISPRRRRHSRTRPVGGCLMTAVVEIPA